MRKTDQIIQPKGSGAALDRMHGTEDRVHCLFVMVLTGHLVKTVVHGFKKFFALLEERDAKFVLVHFNSFLLLLSPAQWPRPTFPRQMVLQSNPLHPPIWRAPSSRVHFPSSAPRWGQLFRGSGPWPPQ